MKKSVLSLLTIAATAVPLVAIAHPGHDGASSPHDGGGSLLHYLFSGEHLLAAVGIGLLLAVVLRRARGTN